MGIFKLFSSVFLVKQGAVFIGQGSGLVGERHLLATGLSKVVSFDAQISLLGVIVSGLSKVLSFGAQISLIGVSKLSKSRIQVVGGRIVVT